MNATTQATHTPGPWAYSTLWTHVSFYVPQDTAAAKSAARKFIKLVKSLGGQGVVVSRGRGAGLLCCSFDKAVATLEAALPGDAELRLVPVTDKQVEVSRNFWGKVRCPARAVLSP